MLGEFCALAAALTWSVSVILFKRTERFEGATPLGMNLFKNVVAAVLLVATLAVLREPIPLGRSQADWLRLTLSGVLGIGVADTLIFMALRRLGAGLLAVVDCAYAPCMVLLSAVVLGEPVTGAFLLGGGLVVGGVLVTTAERPTDAAPAPSRAPGVVLGLLGIVAMAAGVVIAKPVLERAHLVEVTLVRLVAGVAAQGVWIVLRPQHRTALTLFRDRSSWKVLVPASVLGTYVAMLFWLGGFKWAAVSVASILNQTSSVFTVLLAWLLLREPLTLRRLTGTLCAVAGAVLILATEGHR